MGNLFFVFTPLQLFVSQQIIRQEGLKDCVLVECWRKLFADAYDMMRMDELWLQREEWQDYSQMIGNRLKSWDDVKTTREGYKKLRQLCKQYNVENIYLGEVLNQTCRFTAVMLSHLGYKINFFEEGTSHYVNRPYTEHSGWKERLKQWTLDTFYFKPLYGAPFAKWHCTPNRPYEGELPMDRRFSMIPFHHKPFDTRLKVEPMFSEKLKAYVEANIPTGDSRRVMLMTDPLRELMEQKDLYLYFDTIRETIEQLPADVTLYLKFHPREIESSRKRILEIAQQSGRKFKVLSEEVNICVEYYLQRCQFEKIYFFNAATYFYNGYAFPRTEFVKLMPVVYQKAKAAGVGNLTYMENMLKMIEPIAIEQP